MLNMLGNLTKAAISTALTPVAAAVDVVMIIPDSCDGDRPMFSRTAALMENAGECVEQEVKPSKQE